MSLDRQFIDLQSSRTLCAFEYKNYKSINVINFLEIKFIFHKQNKPINAAGSALCYETFLVTHYAVKLHTQLTANNVN